jgi:hypothetical protein
MLSMTDKKPPARKEPDKHDEPAPRSPAGQKEEKPVSDGDAIADLGDATGGPA